MTISKARIVFFFFFFFFFKSPLHVEETTNADISDDRSDFFLTEMHFETH